MTNIKNIPWSFQEPVQWTVVRPPRHEQARYELVPSAAFVVLLIEGSWSDSKDQR